MSDTSESKPAFDPNQQHMNTPRLRPIRGFQAQAKGSDGTEVPMVGLADKEQISEKVVFTQIAAVQLLPLMDGSRTLDQLVEEVGRGLTRPIIEELVAQLDDAGLLMGPRFDAILAEMHRQFDATANLPPASTIQFAESLLKEDEQKLEVSERDALATERLRTALDEFIKQAIKDAPDASLPTLPKAIVAPHLDYHRGWNNYAAIWGRLREVSRPERILVLGTNHFGRATGVCACDKGYTSPFGTSELAADLLAALKRNLGPDLGDAVVAHRYDHEREHSIELQIPWLQHIFGKDEQGHYPQVLGVLIHDPTANNGESYDGKGVGMTSFVDAMKKAIAAVPGRTLVVASADLAHVGPSFGDEHPLAEKEGPGADFRQKVIESDIESLRALAGLDEQSADQSAVQRAANMISSMAWQGNMNRWCSIGNMAAAMMVTEPAETKLLNYAAAIDPQGQTMVSSCAMFMN